MLKQFEKCFPGVWKLTFDDADSLTPHFFFGDCASSELFHRDDCDFPFSINQVLSEKRKNGYLITLPVDSRENFYGMGMQLHSFRQNGTRKTLRTNADPIADTGDSHAPVPFFVSSAGYGILADTAKCATFDFGTTRKLSPAASAEEVSCSLGGSTADLYQEKARSSYVNIFVPQAQGLTVYVFADETMLGVVERYNLFCGGGAMPPIWGLGNLYRCYTKSTQEDVETLVQQFQEQRMPFSMLGLEPGWQSHSYSCSFKWAAERFPDPAHLIQTVHDSGMRLNLWEQAYVHPTADIYEEICPYSGDFEVWEGAVPDLALPKAREIYGKSQNNLIEQGVDAVKLDECDGSDYTGDWYFPAFSSFPSGLTGEEEKNLYGALVQRSIMHEFEKRNLRTYSQVRANWSYAAPMSFVLYSDLYDHRQFLRGLCTSTFSGLLWSPEVRQCNSAQEVLRRLQMVVFSPLSLINDWMIPIPVWQQYDIDKNLQGEALPDTVLQDACRELLELRNRLVPYLYTAFARYSKNGTPPFRALVMDYPQDPKTADISDSYMMGDSLLVAPILEGQTGRDIYLPAGDWYDFYTGEKLSGSRTIHVETEEIPVYVKKGSVLALADGNTIQPDTVISLDLQVYGTDSGCVPLVADDRISLDYRNGAQDFSMLIIQNGVLVSDCPKGYQVRSVNFIG